MVGGVEATLFIRSEQWAYTHSGRHWEGDQQRFSAKCTCAWDLEMPTTLGVANFRVRTERVGGKQRRATEGRHSTRKKWIGGVHGKCALAAAKCGGLLGLGRRGPMGGEGEKKGRLTLWRTWEDGYLVKVVADNRGSCRWAGSIGCERSTGATDRGYRRHSQRRKGRRKGVVPLSAGKKDIWMAITSQAGWLWLEGLLR